MKKVAKLLITLSLFLILTGVVLIKRESITTLLNTYFSSNTTKVSITNINEYYRDYDFLYVQNIYDIVIFKIY